MGQSLEKRKEGFPRERRFQEVPPGTAQRLNRHQLRQPWALFAQVYRYFFARQGPSFRQIIATRSSLLVDQTIIASYRSTLALTIILHAALLLYCGVTLTKFSSPSSSSIRNWVSGDSSELAIVPGSAVGKKIFTYSGGSWEHDYSSVDRLLSSATRRRLGSKETETLTEAIVTIARDHHVDPVFVATLVKHESGFRRSVVSSAGAIGLMQLLPSTGQFVCSLQKSPWGGPRRLCTPSYNLKLGITYLKHLLQKFPHNLSHVLIAYNWGPGNLQRALARGRTIPKGPIWYARSILREYSQARSLKPGQTVSTRLKPERKIGKDEPVPIMNMKKKTHQPERDRKRDSLVF